MVLRDVDLDVAPHDVVCLIGASGSGKSTLLRCLNLLETVDDGTIGSRARTITDPRVDARAVRRRMGMVFQAYNLFPHMSVLDNLTLAPRKVHGVPARRPRSGRTSCSSRFGLADKAGEHPDRLSGGQQQRAALARALATDPALVLLDEVTSALDPELVGEVLDIVRDLAPGRDDHGAGHPRDGLRPRGGDPGLLPARRRDPGAGPARARCSATRPTSAPGSSCAASL